MPEIVLEDVRFAYPGGADVYPEPGLSLRLEGGVVALVGENGAGKTTLTKLLNGLLRPSAGRLTVGGVAVGEATVAEMARVVGYAFQNPDDQLFERTVRAEAGFGPRALGIPAQRAAEAVARALELCGLAGREETHPHDLGLSERKWVAIASALAAEAPIVVLDEPTLGQDYHARQRLQGLVRELDRAGRLVLVVTHDMDFVAETCPTAVVLTHGVLRHCGPTAEAFADQRLIAEAGLRAPYALQLARALDLDAISEAGLVEAWRRRAAPGSRAPRPR